MKIRVACTQFGMQIQLSLIKQMRNLQVRQYSMAPFRSPSSSAKSTRESHRFASFRFRSAAFCIVYRRFYRFLWNSSNQPLETLLACPDGSTFPRARRTAPTHRALERRNKLWFTRGVELTLLDDVPANLLGFREIAAIQVTLSLPQIVRELHFERFLRWIKGVNSIQTFLKVRRRLLFFFGASGSCSGSFRKEKAR